MQNLDNEGPIQNGWPREYAAGIRYCAVCSFLGDSCPLCRSAINNDYNSVKNDAADMFLLYEHSYNVYDCDWKCCNVCAAFFMRTLFQDSCKLHFLFHVDMRSSERKKLPSRSTHHLRIRCSCLLQFCSSALAQPTSNIWLTTCTSSVDWFKHHLNTHLYTAAFNRYHVTAGNCDFDFFQLTNVALPTA